MIKKILMSCLIVLIASSVAFASSGKIKVKGDAKTDGKLYITLNWQVDTGAYRDSRGNVLSKPKVRKKVADEMWGQLLPVLAKKTEGMKVSFDEKQFITTEEWIKLVKMRDDGSKIVDVRIKLTYNVDDQNIVTSKKHTKKEDGPNPRFTQNIW